MEGNDNVCDSIIPPLLPVLSGGPPLPHPAGEEGVPHHLPGAHQRWEDLLEELAGDPGVV